MATPAAAFVSPTNLRRVGTANATTLTIPARNGYRHILLDIYQRNQVIPSYFDVQIGTRTYMRIPSPIVNSDVLSPVGTNHDGRGFLWWWSKIFGEANLPNAAEDEDINIVASASLPRIDAYYLEVKTDNVSSHSVPGGSDAPLKPFIEILDTTLTKVGNGQNVLNENMPTGLGLLDQSGRVKSTTRFTINTMMADYQSTGANYTQYTRLHIFDEDEELYTPLNHEGLLIDEVNFNNDIRFSFVNLSYFRADKDYVFEPNHQVSVLADVSAVTGTGSMLRVAFFGVRERIGGGGGG